MQFSPDSIPEWAAWVAFAVGTIVLVYTLRFILKALSYTLLAIEWVAWVALVVLVIAIFVQAGLVCMRHQGIGGAHNKPTAIIEAAVQIFERTARDMQTGIKSAIERLGDGISRIDISFASRAGQAPEAQNGQDPHSFEL